MTTQRYGFFPFFVLVALLAFPFPVLALDMAITVDDLPIHGHVSSEMNRHKIVQLFLSAFQKHKLSGVYGFINAQQLKVSPHSEDVLDAWIHAGQLLGNHTYSHINLNHVSAQAFIKDIQKDEPTLQKLMGSQDYHYFRYPYLAEGLTQAKRDTVRKYLSEQKYKTAQVTVDFSDWEWNHSYFRCLAKKDVEAIVWLKKTFLEEALQSIEVAKNLSQLTFHREIKQIFLIHHGALQALMIDELLTEFQSHQIHFVPLSEALQDGAYSFNPNVLRKRTDAFLNQVRLAKDLENPVIVRNIKAHSSESKVLEICRKKAKRSHAKSQKK